MNTTLAFDVYGTLVDPFGMAKHLAHDLGAKAANFANCWREKQLEYSFRRALMRNYADFSVCTSETMSRRRFAHCAPHSVSSPAFTCRITVLLWGTGSRRSIRKRL